ncbi:MAG: hypothetical protein ACO32J_07775, partial [Phycisphaerales bacterium]
PEGWRTESQTRLRLGRGGTMLDMTTGGWIVESDDGRPISGGRTQTGGGQAVRVTWTYGSEGVVERTIDGARVNERRWPPLASEALPPPRGCEARAPPSSRPSSSPRKVACRSASAWSRQASPR